MMMMLWTLIVVVFLIQNSFARPFAASFSQTPLTAVRSQEDVTSHLRTQLAAHHAGSWSEYVDMRLINVQRNARGSTYHHFQETYKGLLVENSAVVVHVDSNDNVVSMVGEVCDFSSYDDSDPRLTAEEAFAEFSGRVTNFELLSETEHSLWSGVRAKGKRTAARLSYSAAVQFRSGEGSLRLGRAVLDASTAELLQFKSSLHQQLDRRVYYYPDECTMDEYTLISNFNSDLRRTEGQAATGNDSVDYAFYNMGAVYHAFNREFDWLSHDGQDSDMVATVEVQWPDFDSSCFGGNAFWLGSPYSQMVFLVDTFYLWDLSHPLDVVAHEITHGVIDSTANLAYEFESGAINEGVSDALGVFVKAWDQSGGDESTTPADVSTNIGNETNNTYWVAYGHYINGPLRYMNNPTLDGSSVDNYDDLLECECTHTVECLESCYYEEDYGYVHANSGIFNMFFYLLAEGGAHPSLPCAIDEPLGIRDAAALVFSTLRYRMSEATTFEQLRYHLALEAREMFGETAYERVHQTMDCVRVPGEIYGEDGDDDSDLDTTGLIVGGVLGGCALLAGAAFAVYWRRSVPSTRTAPQNSPPLSHSDALATP